MLYIGSLTELTSLTRRHFIWYLLKSFLFEFYTFVNLWTKRESRSHKMHKGIAWIQVIEIEYGLRISSSNRILKALLTKFEQHWTSNEDDFMTVISNCIDNIDINGKKSQIVWIIQWILKSILLLCLHWKWWWLLRSILLIRVSINKNNDAG